LQNLRATLRTLEQRLRALLPWSRAPHAPHAARDWQRTSDALASLLDRSPSEQSGMLDALGASDAQLRRDVEALLRAHQHTGPLDHPLLDSVSIAHEDATREPAWGPDTIGSHYRLMGPLGDGGMGVVVKAWDQRLERTVALKFLPAYLLGDAVARERLRVEAQAAASLDHPNVCTIFEVGETPDDRFFIAMPYYHGETIAARLTRGPLTIEDAVSLALQTARGLAAAHERGIIHRDIKPANLIVTSDGVLKILDFGIAKLGGTTITAPGLTPGTASYMSPEQTCADPVDARTDIWSLGVVMYEMLTGVRPFRGTDTRTVAAAICISEPESIIARRGDVPPSLNHLVCSALAKNPAERPASVARFAAELEAIGSLLGLNLASTQRRRGEREHADTVPQFSIDGEGREAAVLTLRVSGHATLIETRGPEHAATEMQRIRARVSDIAARFDGIVNRIDGDGAVVLFGVSHAREDDCLRAARAAVALARCATDECRDDPATTASRLRIHVGMDAGRLIVRPSTDAAAPFLVAGPALDLASRLASMAPAGAVWVGPRCRRLIEPPLRLTSRDGVTAFDEDRPVTPYEITGESEMHTRIEAALQHGEITPYTGREREIAVVRDCLAQACAGDGQFVVILGEAGLGKSRLLQELLPRNDDGGFTVLYGRCLSYGASTAYLPFIDVLREALGFAQHADASHATADALARMHANAPELEEFLPLYLRLLSVPAADLRLSPHLQGEEFRLMAREAIAAFITTTSRQRPTALVLEDWHWVDDASHAVLGQIAELVSHYPLLVVVTSRPGYVNDWGTVAPHATVTLTPFAERSTHDLLRAALQASDVPAPLAALLHERTGGNPFFLEEMCHALQEDGTLRVADGTVEIAGSIDSLRLPGTVQAVIRARLDRLDSQARDALLVSSVIGREFGRDLLELTLDDASSLNAAIQSLKTAGLIQQIRIAPTATYRFKHVLMQEVAYATLLEHRRRTLHGRVGHAIESLGIALPDDQLERLAHHFARAELWEKAVHYAILAADRATILAEFSEAMQLLERAQSWLAALPADAANRARAVDLLLRQERLGETLGLRERQQHLIDEMVALLRAGDDPAQLAEVYMRQGDLHTLLRRFDAADAALNQSLRLRRELHDPVGVRHALRSLGLLRWHQGRDSEALVHIEEALTIDRDRGDEMAVLGDLSNLGDVLKGLGRYEEAKARLTEGIELSERILAQTPDAAVKNDAAVKQFYLIHILANVYRQVGESERALDIMQRATESTIGERLPIQLSYHYTAVAHLSLEAGRIDESLDHYRTAIDLTRRANFVPGLSHSLRVLGEVLLALGRGSDALPLLQEAARLFAQLENRASEADLWEDIARVHEQEHHDVDALSSWTKSRVLRREQRDRAGELTAVEGLGRVTRRLVAEPSLALPHFHDAAGLAASLADRRTEGRLRNVIGILEFGRTNYVAALDQYELALDAFSACEDTEGVGLALNSIGLTQRTLGRLDEARETLARALAYNELSSRADLLGHTLGMLGAVEIDLGAPDLALPHLERSRAIRVQSGDTRGEGWMCYELSRAAAATAMQDRARELLADCARAAQACGDRELGEACERLRFTVGP
jgi:serine/threonine protein kinase/tetratricopeptide (TPR) repeat protein